MIVSQRSGAGWSLAVVVWLGLCQIDSGLASGSSPHSATSTTSVSQSTVPTQTLETVLVPDAAVTPAAESGKSTDVPPTVDQDPGITTDANLAGNPSPDSLTGNSANLDNPFATQGKPAAVFRPSCDAPEGWIDDEPITTICLSDNEVSDHITLTPSPLPSAG
jgi:hypothetical protein